MENRIYKLKSMRESVNFEIEQERIDLVRQLYDLIRDWEGKLPNLRDIFQLEELEWLLIESLKITVDQSTGIHWEDVLVDFVIRSGYKDEPMVDENGTISLRRTTPVHRAKDYGYEAIYELLKIYNRFDLNYSDESGYTHFHAACENGCDDHVEKFLKLGQDPNCLVQDTGDSPLHVAGTWNQLEISELLLKHGANPNLVNNDGLTPLHCICKGHSDCDVIEIFFKINDDMQQQVRIDAKDKLGRTPLHLAVFSDKEETAQLLLKRGADPNSVDNDGSTPLHYACKRRSYWNMESDMVKIFFTPNKEVNQLVQVDTRDKLGRTPLQLAVAKLLPNIVDFLFDLGADLSSFIFPTDNDFDELNKHDKHVWERKTKLASGLVVIVERLEKRGYELDRSDALVVMKFFANYGLFEESEEFQQFWYEHEEFASKSKEKKILPSWIWPEYVSDTEKGATTMSPSLLLHDLVRMPTEEAIKLPTYYYEVASWRGIHNLSENLQKACTMHLCEMVSRRFFRRWTLDFFWELVQYRLPILCCEIIIKKLKNEDLFNICLAAMGQSS